MEVVPENPQEPTREQIEEEIGQHEQWFQALGQAQQELPARQQRIAFLKGVLTPGPEPALRLGPVLAEIDNQPPNRAARRAKATTKKAVK